MDLDEIYLVNYLTSALPFSVLLLKGKGGLCLVALVAGLIPGLGNAVALVGAIRLAKPNSWWARRWYDRAKMKAARARFPDASDRPAVVLAAIGGVALVAWTVLAVVAAVMQVT